MYFLITATEREIERELLLFYWLEPDKPQTGLAKSNFKLASTFRTVNFQLEVEMKRASGIITALNQL